MNHFVEAMYQDGKAFQHLQLSFQKAMYSKSKRESSLILKFRIFERQEFWCHAQRERENNLEVFKVSEDFLSKYKTTTGYLLKIFFKHLEIWDIICLLNCTSFTVIYIYCQANLEILVTSMMTAETKISPPWKRYQGKWSSALFVDYCWQLEIYNFTKRKQV
jgi:hypothetical protein